MSEWGKGRGVLTVARRERSQVRREGQSQVGLMTHRLTLAQNEPQKYQNTILPLCPTELSYMGTDYKIHK